MSFEDHMIDAGFDDPSEYMDYLEGEADDFLDSYSSDTIEEEKKESCVFYYDELASIRLQLRGKTQVRFSSRIETDSKGRSLCSIVVSGFEDATKTSFEHIIYPGYYATAGDLLLIPDEINDLICRKAVNKIRYSSDGAWHIVAKKQPVWTYILSKGKLIHFSGDSTDDYVACPWIRDPLSNDSTVVTQEDEVNSFMDRKRVVYSNDKRLLLNGEAPSPPRDRPPFRLFDPDAPKVRSLVSYQIPDGTKFICDEAFRSFHHLKEITIPNTVVAIGESAFSYCSEIIEIRIPDSVQAIGFSAFSGCYSLSTVIIENPSIRIDESSFRGCSSLKEVRVPSGTRDLFISYFGEIVIESNE